MTQLISCSVSLHWDDSSGILPVQPLVLVVLLVRVRVLLHSTRNHRTACVDLQLRRQEKLLKLCSSGRFVTLMCL